MSNLKILQVARDAADTGGGKVVIETSYEFLKLGHSVTLLTDTRCSELPEGIDACYTPFGDSLKKWKPKSKFTRIVRHFLQMIFFSFFSLFIIRKYKRGNYIVLNHNLESLIGDIYVLHNVFNYENSRKNFFSKTVRWFNPVFLFRAGRERILLGSRKEKVVICVSDRTNDEAKEFCHANKKLVTINNGVNPDFFFYKKPDINGDVIKLIFVGHEFERKGLKYIIDSLVFLPEKISLIVIGGGGSTQKFYETYAEKKKVRHRVLFKGTVVGLELLKIYHECHVFLLPSSYEAWPLVGLESMACGLPALMTPVGGIPEFLIEGYNGGFITRDGNNIAQAVLRIVGDDVNYSKLSLGARETAEKNSWKICAEKYISIIK
jgi:glycosyltransferase involved in cell wall biosynthesis